MPKVARKQFDRLTDLAIAAWEQKTPAAIADLEKWEDEIGWPWRATQEQIDYWNELHERMFQ